MPSERINQSTNKKDVSKKKRSIHNNNKKDKQKWDTIKGINEKEAILVEEDLRKKNISKGKWYR